MFNHGGNIYQIERDFDINKEEIIDYSSNINFLGFNKKIKNTIIKNIHLIDKYPDIEYYDLKKSISDFYNLDMRNILVGNGAIELIFLFCKTLSLKKTLILSPTFLEYEKALLNSNTQTDYFELQERNNFNLDLDILKEKLIKDYDLLVICNPNNPTGNLIKIEELQQIFEITKNNNIKILIDESFIDFSFDDEKKSSINLLKNYQNVFLIKSLTKFFSIPGLRLGFGVSYDADLVNILKENQEPWSINCFSAIIGECLFDENYIKKSKKMMDIERNRFISKLKQINNIKVFDTQTNFILIKLLEHLNAFNLQKNMLKDKILIRNCANFKFLSDKFIRIAIKNSKNNNYFTEKFKYWCNNG